MELAIQTRGLVKTFRGVEAVRGIDLEVQRNTIFGFLGPNGAGKTTTIKLLLGLVRPTRGTATVFGQDIGRDTLEIRRRVGYLAQDPRYYEHMTARETLRFTARFFFKTGAPLDRRIQQTLELVGLADRADRPIRGFSGGERQRLGIAQAQINHPDLLILDEPAASLDPMGRRDVLAVMANLREHTTIFYSTHILDDVQRVSDTVAIMHQGKLIAQAPIGELLSGRKGETTYTIAISGETADARRRIDTFPWIARIEEAAENGGMRWLVHTTDSAAAEATLLRSILASERVTVTAFGKQTHDLEDVFLRVVEAADNAA
jgi:ABC-2 type transport system ATP-binding protein